MKKGTAIILRVTAFLVLVGMALTTSFSQLSQAQNGSTASGTRTVEQPAQPTPTPPKKEDEVTLSSDDVVRVETNLTNIFFTAADKQKRFVSTLKREDVRVLEDGVPQEIFTFQPNSDIPLSLAVLIDCSGSEERTLPEEKGAAREFLESVLRPEKDEAAIVTFTGEVTLEQGLTGNVGRLRRAIDDVRFVPPAGYIGGGVVVGGTPPISGTQQTLAGDVSAAPGDNAGPDHDYASSPILTVFPDGRRVLLAGQKSGVMHALNPESGELIWKMRAGEGGVLGGIEWGFATDGAVVYIPLSNALEKKAGEAGGLVAIGVLDGKTRWSTPPPADTCGGKTGCNTGQPAAVTGIPGVVFSGGLDGHLRAYDTSSGRIVWDIDTAHEFDTVNRVPARGGSINGPGATIAGGMLFVSSGYSSLGFMPGNVLLAFSVDGK